MKKVFPDGFMWGAATSSHQVEGGNNNDWTAWEDAGKIKNNDKSGEACDHWNRYEEDFDLLKKLNLNTYRLSIEWSRVEPSPGKFDADAIAHYKKMIRALRIRDIEPVVTLHHFTNPKWLPSWAYKTTSRRYIEYVRYVVHALGDEVTYWMTFNEPNLFVGIGYMQGNWPPGDKHPLHASKALSHIHKSHKKAYKMIHKMYDEMEWSEPKVSMALNLQHYESVNNNPINIFWAWIGRYITNSYTLNKVRYHIDWIGVNFYFSHWMSVFSQKKSAQIKIKQKKSDLGWEIYPDGLYKVLVALQKYKLPVMITENGLADAGDKYREDYIVEHLDAVWRAKNDGVNIIGYLHWSLMDNFEWLEGYEPRFGLVEIDYKTQKRKIRKSAKRYAKIAEANSLGSSD